MVFIRTKKIYNQDYAYLVKNEWTSQGSRQKSSKYLGKVFSITKKTDIHKIEGENYHEIIKNLIKQELFNHNSQGFEYFDSKIILGRREVILSINEGFLCAHTIQQLLNFKPSNINEGEKLANLLVETGIKLTPEQFVELCNKIFPKDQNKKDHDIEPEEFYY
ncbi:hypothetical protein COV11_03195 [Candidatus Woesearchaeota archaeon CG10_big_fil_rev_8_21_14_0_10_30_7]|nr:MAG: hypothetical protein COV11_03195 [Candidatus Woesearchaeota archaeon CG10_big_fil_rev_8_21_14_0_10_30_7]